MRALVALACAALVTAAVAAEPATAGGRDPYGEVLNILPPGSTGNVDAADLVTLGPGKAVEDPASLLSGLQNPQGFFTTATPSAPTNFADQLEKYDRLNTADPKQLTDAHLRDYFKNGSLGVDPADVVRTERPRPGVTIEWDKDGVPHITGKTDGDVAYGAGVAVMEDPDVRHRRAAAHRCRHDGPVRRSHRCRHRPGRRAAPGRALHPRAADPADRGTGRELARGCPPDRGLRRLHPGHQRQAARALPRDDGVGPAARRARPGVRRQLPGGVRRPAAPADAVQEIGHRLDRLAGGRHLRDGWRRSVHERDLAAAAAGEARCGRRAQGLRRPPGQERPGVPGQPRPSDLRTADRRA